MKAQVSKQERELGDQGRDNEDLENQLAIFQRVIDEDNISTGSDSSGTDYDLMDLSSDAEEEPDIDLDSGISFTTDNNSLATSTRPISSQRKARLWITAKMNPTSTLSISKA